MHFLFILSLTEKRAVFVPVGNAWLLVPLAQSNLINFSCSLRAALHLHMFSNMNKSSSSDFNQKYNKKGQAFFLLKQEVSKYSLSRVCGDLQEGCYSLWAHLMPDMV